MYYKTLKTILQALGYFPHRIVQNTEKIYGITLFMEPQKTQKTVWAKLHRFWYLELEDKY